MPLEATLSRRSDGKHRARSAWREALGRLALVWFGLIALAWNAWADMAHQWWNVSTYSHILLIPPILAGLVYLRRAELVRLAPDGWWPGLLLLAGSLLVWLAGSQAEVNLVAQIGAVTMLQASLAALLGPRAVAGLLFPLGYMLALVPFGDELIPALQAITARMAVALTRSSGVPATIEGVFIDTPAGLFEVAEACAGVKFLMAMAALGALVAHLGFVSWKRRALFMAAALVVPVLANGVRAWGTIYVAQTRGMQFAAGFDHLVYGWLFFALVMLCVLGAAWRKFDRPPDDRMIDLGRIESSALLARMARLRMGRMQALAAVSALALAATWMDRLAQLA